MHLMKRIYWSRKCVSFNRKYRRVEKGRRVIQKRDMVGVKVTKSKLFLD